MGRHPCIRSVYLGGLTFGPEISRDHFWFKGASVAFWGSTAPPTCSYTRRSGFATQSFVPLSVTRVQAPVVAWVAAAFVAALLGA